MSLGLIFVIIGAIIKLVEFIFKNNSTTSIFDKVLQSLDNTPTHEVEKTSVSKQIQHKKVRENIRGKVNNKDILSQETVSNEITDENSPIFASQDLVGEQLVKNIIFSEILSTPKSKR